MKIKKRNMKKRVIGYLIRCHKKKQNPPYSRRKPNLKKNNQTQNTVGIKPTFHKHWT